MARGASRARSGPFLQSPPLTHPGARRDQLGGTVEHFSRRTHRKRPLDLHIMYRLWHTRHDMPSPEHLLAELHEVGDRVLAIANVLLQLESDECRRFGLVENETPRETFLREEAEVGEEELVLRARGGRSGEHGLRVCRNLASPAREE